MLLIKCLTSHYNMLFLGVRLGEVWLAYIGIADNSQHLFLKLK